MIKRIISAMTAIAFLIVLSVGVSADYVTMLDHGLYYNEMGQNSSLASSGETISAFYLKPFWALESYNPDYTYTFIFSFKTTTKLNFKDHNLLDVLVANFKSGDLQPGDDGSYKDTKSYYNLSENYDSLNKIYTYVFKVVSNPSMSGWDGFPVYVYFRTYLKSGNTKLTTNHWGVSCEYDPGGSKFLEDYLDQIVNAGSGYPVPDGSTLDSSVNSLNSAEDAVKDKSSSLINSVSSEMQDNLSQAKALSTTLKPAAVQINNIYNSFLSILPAEVKAVFIAVPLLLFVGWLVGRIKE